MEAFGKLCFIIISMVLSVLLGGFVLMKLWGWFIVPVLHVQTISVVQAMGISCFVNMFKGMRNNKESDDTYADSKKLVNSFAKLFGFYGFTLLLGYIISLFL